MDKIKNEYQMLRKTTLERNEVCIENITECQCP